jgi:DNA helicase TIP49 (TBP-interacting protein)
MIMQVNKNASQSTTEPADQRQPTDLSLHPQANKLARQFAYDFAYSLILQAKILAHQRKDEMVLKKHIEEAYDIISEKRKREWTKDLLI